MFSSPHASVDRAGFAVFDALANVAMTARANAQASADEAATDEAMQSWVQALSDRDATIAELNQLVVMLTDEGRKNMDAMMRLGADLATAHQIFDDIAAGA